MKRNSAHRRSAWHYGAFIATLTLVCISIATASDGSKKTNERKTMHKHVVWGGSVVLNGGFENSMEGWKDAGYLASQAHQQSPLIDVDKRNLLRGSASLRLDSSNKRQKPSVYQDLNFTKGQASDLKVTAWVRTDRKAKASVQVLFETAGKQGDLKIIDLSPETKVDPNTSNWAHYVGELDIPTGTDRIEILLSVEGPGSAWFDDVTAAFPAR